MVIWVSEDSRCLRVPTRVRCPRATAATKVHGPIRRVPSSPASTVTSQGLEQRLRDTVDYLCSDECLPRNPGTGGGTAAGKYLGRRLADLDLEPLGEHGYLQQIPQIDGANLLAAIPGSGDTFILLGAHYDAAGWDNPGADDNAAGVAITLEVARRLVDIEMDRRVVIALFDAEEPPYFLSPEMGSQWFVDHPTVPLDRIETMICLDLVGHALGPDELPGAVRDSVFVLGAEKSTGTGALVDELPAVKGIVPRRVDTYIVPPMSDYDAFMSAEIPFLFYTMGRSEHYHAPTDTPDLLDYPKMAAFTDHLVDLVTALVNRSDTPAYLANGFDDHATMASLRSLLDPLIPVFPEAGMADQLVIELEAVLLRDGSLDTDTRQVIAALVLQLESAFA